MPSPKSILIALFALVFLVAACPARAEVYEVILGGQAYAVEDGKPSQVTLPDGSKLDLVVRKPKVQQFTGKAISFLYSSEMKVASEKELGMTMITAECEKSPLFVAQIFPYQLSPEEAVDTFILTIKEQFKSFNAVIPENPISLARRNIGGKPIQGKVLRSMIGDLANQTEVYAYNKDGKTIAMMFQTDSEDQELAKRYFKIIADSIK